MQDNPDRYRAIPNVFLVRLSKLALKSDLCGCQSCYQLGVWNNLRYTIQLFCFVWSEVFKMVTVHIWSTGYLLGGTDGS